MISPWEAAMPVLRPADSPRGPALASTRTAPLSRCSLYSLVRRSSRAWLWSTTRSVSRAGRDWARTEATAARMSSQRSSVYTQTTTETAGSFKTTLPGLR